MSWFDATGIASLAKTALKEAQKTIDKALDIKDDDEVSTLTETESTDENTTSNMKSMKHSISNPILSTVGSAAVANNIWGSFTGTFFDATAKDNNVSPAVTIAPTISTAEVRSTGRSSNETSGRTSTGSTSESVEVLSSPMTPSSNLTSPSISNMQSTSTMQQTQTPSESIEVLAAVNDTPLSSELLSPVSIPSSIGVVTSTSCTSISESVEVVDESSIQSTEENLNAIVSSSVEELRLPEDEEDSVSYNSISESTAPVTIMDSSPQKLPITVAPSRSGLHLNLTGHPTPSTSQLHLPVLAEVDSAKPKERRSPSYIERTLESFEAQTQLSDSTQSFEDVQQILLDEASVLKITRTSDASQPDTSDKIYVQKISTATGTSEQNSGHTSADEVETATSSDIEIISGPNGNGDSSSTHSAAGLICKSSPLKTGHSHTSSNSQYVICTKRKGHCRELSEASSYSLQSESGSDSCSQSASEIEKMVHRINELLEVLEARESKLVELGRDNAELREKNNELKSQVDGLRCRPDTHEMNTIAEEYAQRMSALEKKFQQTLRERDALRTQLKATQTSLTSKNDFDEVIKEKDFMINELKTEGEKLSKQILQHSNIIKKLRSKEKETDATVKRQTEQIDEMKVETERLKKSLSAKDEVERTQMEAVHKLSSEKRKLLKDLTQAKSDSEDSAQKLRSLQISLDAAKKEVTERQQDHSSLSKKAKDLVNLQADHQILLVQNQQLTTELESLRNKLKNDSFTQSVHQQKLKQENMELLRKLEEVEQRSEEQSNAISEATIPLVRQCEALQTTLNDRTNSWEKQEMILLKKIDILEKQFKNVSLVEQTANEQTAQLNARIQNLEDSLSKALLRSEKSAVLLQQKQVELDLLQTEYRKCQDSVDELKRKSDELIDELKKENVDLKTKFSDKSQKETVPQMTTQESAMQTSIRNVDGDLMSMNENRFKPIEIPDTNSSPTQSLGQISQSNSLESNVWPLEDIDSISNIGRPSLGNASLYGGNSFAVGGTTMIETLQASLKQKDGENHHLQWELSRLQSERNFLLAEVSSLNNQLETLKEKLSTHETTSAQFTELQEQYDAILQMYGEKVEENDELQLDLQDVKDMYRAQIDDLLVQQRQMQQKILNYQQELGQK